MAPNDRTLGRLMTLSVLVLALAACSDQPPSSATATGGQVAQTDDVVQAQAAKAPVSPDDDRPSGATEIEWDALIPDDYRPDKLMAQYNVDELADDDPRAAELMDKLRTLWDQAPVRDDLDGREIKLPGFVVPVDGDENQTTGFLLVPYYGACIHVPPPPANQTVYVLTEPGNGIRPGLFDVVWVTGTMAVKRVENDLAEAGYTLYASAVTPYE